MVGRKMLIILVQVLEGRLGDLGVVELMGWD